VSQDGIVERFDREVERMGVRLRDADQFKVMENVFDEVTLLALYRLVHKKHLSVIGGPISTGKEANIFFGENVGSPVAIKIYRVQSASFKSMSEYLIGDPRFSSVRKTRKEIIFAWARKEFANLLRAKEAGVVVPEPLVFDRNILLMEFLGEDEVPYPQLRNAELEDPLEDYHEVLGMMKILFQKARLIHADLSEFNILAGDRLYFIDFAQGITPDHPKAMSFLARDIKNINRFFSGKCEVLQERDIFEGIVGAERFSP
jgi:RIO kinase 1